MDEYTTKRKISSWVTAEQQDLYQSLSGLHRGSHAADEQYLQDLKQTVLTEHIHVFTPSGDIFSVPRGSTGVDFAFAVNPDALSHLAAIRIDGEVTEATRILQEGDTVELVLLENGEDGKQTLWVEKVKSVEAREGLKHSLRRSPKQKRREQGMKLLEQECQKLRLPTWSLTHFHRLQTQLAGVLKKESFDTILEEIGSGSLPVVRVVETYKSLVTRPRSFFVHMLKFFRLLPRTRVLNKKASVIEIEVYAEDRMGLIYDITKCFAERRMNIARFSVYAVPPTGGLYIIRFEVNDFKEFSDLYDAILQVPSVTQVLRTR